MRLTVIVDNLCGSPNLLGEHGLSLMVETPRGSLLFDTGQGSSLIHNMGELGFSVNDVNKVCLSHGHYDHCGGLPQLLRRKPDLEIWASVAVGAPHFSGKSDSPAFIGMDLNLRHRNFIPVKEPTEILSGLWAFSVPVDKRAKDFIHTGKLLVPRGEGWEQDPFEDDLSLLAMGTYGPSLILGCAHSGVMNIMRYVRDTFGYDNFYSVVGGTHLSSVPKDRLTDELEDLKKEFKVDKWRPNHCTGFIPASLLASMNEDVQWASSGTFIEL